MVDSKEDYKFGLGIKGLKAVTFLKRSEVNIRRSSDGGAENSKQVWVGFRPH